MNEECELYKRLHELTFGAELTLDEIAEIIRILERLEEIEPFRKHPVVDVAYEKFKVMINENTHNC